MGERIAWEQEPTRPERNMPGTVETSSFDNMTVDVHRLTHLTERHPVTKVPLQNCLPKLAGDCWQDENKETFTPNSLIEILKNMTFEEATEKYPHYARHIRRIEQADYSVPIHMYKGWVINGVHRIAKLLLLRERGETTQDFITAKELDEIPPEALTSYGLLR